MVSSGDKCYCILEFQLLCRLREQILRELGFRDIFKKVKVNANFKREVPHKSARKFSFIL